jgi:hypothetical protein
MKVPAEKAQGPGYKGRDEDKRDDEIALHVY